MTYFVYILRNPESKDVVYVGYTSDPKQRRYAHKLNYRKQFGYTPIFSIVSKSSNPIEARNIERRLIKGYSIMSTELQNVQICEPIETVEEKLSKRINPIFKNLISQMQFIVK